MELSDCSACDGIGLAFHHPIGPLVSSEGLFLTESELKELVDEGGEKLVDFSHEALCSHQAEDAETSEIHTLWGCYRSLMKENKQLRDENASLRAELKEVQVRLNDMSAAVVGNPEAKNRVSRRVTLESGRNSLVKSLTNGEHSDWLSYRNSFPNGESPCAAGEALKSLAGAMCPTLEAQAQIPPPVQSDSKWKTLAKYRSKDERKAKELSEAEYAKRVQAAQSAQEALALLQDQELWQFVLRS